jgi:membrane-associated HD superfamily phosphohydrolase
MTVEKFGSDPAQTNEPTAQSPEQQQETAFKFRVGDREYDPESAAKKIQAADEFIETLKREKREQEERMRQLEEQLKKVAEIEKLVSEQAVSSKEHSAATTNGGVDVDSLKESLKSEVERVLSEREKQEQLRKQEELKKQTFAKTNEALAKAFGEDVDAKVREKVAEIGISYETALKMASDPEESKVLLKLLLPSGGKETPAPQPSLNVAHKPAQKEMPKISQMSSTELAAYIQQLQANS